MTLLISSDVECQPVSTLKQDISNTTLACKLLMKILCGYFNKFQRSCEGIIFWFCVVARLDSIVKWSILQNSFLINVVQKLSKFIKICKVYSKRFPATFFMYHVCDTFTVLKKVTISPESRSVCWLPPNGFFVLRLSLPKNFKKIYRNLLTNYADEDELR